MVKRQKTSLRGKRRRSYAVERDYDFVNRMAVIARITKEDPGLGRTKLMKYLYILQTVKSVPLGYKFQLYVYGPYDSKVLEDLTIAEAWGAVREELTPSSYGYAYRIVPGAQNGKLVESVKEFVGKHQKAIKWVVDNFSSFSDDKLELLSTIIWADQEARRAGKRRTNAELIKIVHEIKPRLPKDTAKELVEHLKRLNVFQALEA
jgi:uncharacterized protein YwgA